MKSILFTFVFVTAVYAQLPQYNVTMSPGDYQLLFTRDIFSDSLLPAKFEYEGSYWNDAQIRFKGHSTRYYPKKAYRIKFASSHLFQSMRQINFNAMYTDKSFIREKLAWSLFSDMDQMAPSAHHSRLTLNGEPQGLYLFVDKVDKYFLQNHGRIVAPMYEANDTYTMADLTIQPDSLLKLYYDKEVGSTTDYSDLANLIHALNDGPDVTFADTVYKYFDVQSVINWFSGNILTMEGDSYNKNYLLYRDTSKLTQQWTIIPWDYDLSFGRTGDDAIPYPGSLLNDGFAYSFPPLSGPSNVLKDRLMATPSLWEELRTYVDTLLQTVFTEEHLYPQIDSLAQLIAEEVKTDPLKWGTIEEFYYHVEALKYYVTARRNYLLKTFINTPTGEYDIVTLPISQTGIPYHFVSYDGRQIATMWFTDIQGLDSIRIRAYSDSTPPNLINPGDERYVKRWLKITPYPSSAIFKARLQWMYSDVASDYREVGTGVQDESLLNGYLFDGSKWVRLVSAVNPYANIVTIDTISDEQCSAGNFFAILLPESYTQKWFRSPLHYWQKWHDIEFFDSTLGIIVGEQGTVLRTTDGGASWHDNYVGTSLSLMSVSIPTIDKLFAVGDKGMLYKSNDTGKSWTYTDLGVTNCLRGIQFETPLYGLIFGDYGILLSTTDGGINWYQWNLDSTKNIAGVTSSLPSSLTIYFEDGSYIGTHDQGSTWSGGNLGTGRKISCVKKFYNEVWIVGDSGLVIRSFRVNTYENVSIPTSAKLNDIHIIDSAKLYIAGEGGRIYYTTDSGTNWYLQYTADSHDLYTIAFYDSTHGFALGNSGTILVTTSGGTVTDVKSGPTTLPSAFRLHQNYPNPFNPTTRIEFELPYRANVTMRVYNVLGQLVATLLDEVQEPGVKFVDWNVAQNGLASGIYFYSVKIDGGDGKNAYEVRKMAFIK